MKSEGQAIQAMQELRIKHKELLDKVWNNVEKKMYFALKKAEGLDFIPYTVKRGEWFNPNSIHWWTNGFWPASMWQMYIQTGDDAFKTEAERAEDMLDVALMDTERLHHDVGFLWMLSSGVNYRLTGNEQSRRRSMMAANLLAGRFNPLGFIRAWNGEKHTGWAIIDSMMNLSLLYWASEEKRDPRYKKIAMIHADTSLKYFLRPDGSCNHIIQFDPETMEVKGIPGGQGFGPGSSWSRGQAWALYGFIISWIHTEKAEYLEAAKRIAHYFIACVYDDWVPRCDFRQPNQPDIRDNSAGSIAACALLELYRLLPQSQRDNYGEAAIRLLKAADVGCADWGKDSPAILQQCTTAYDNEEGIHIPLNYGDYFFVEALSKLRKDTLFFW